jgi:hypothetical protein
MRTDGYILVKTSLAPGAKHGAVRRKDKFGDGVPTPNSVKKQLLHSIGATLLFRAVDNDNLHTTNSPANAAISKKMVRAKGLYSRFASAGLRSPFGRLAPLATMQSTGLHRFTLAPLQVRVL